MMTASRNARGSTTNESTFVNISSICVSMFSRDLFTGIGKISLMHCGRFWQCDSYHYLVRKG